MLNEVAEDGLNCFVDGYVTLANKPNALLEGLGIRISQYLDFDGLRIMKVFLAALEDSNFHTEAGVVQEWIDELEGDDND